MIGSVVGTGQVQFAFAVHALDRMPVGDDQDVARWVASALYGIATSDEIAPRSADRLLGAAAQIVVDLASGKWREDVMAHRIAAPPGATACEGTTQGEVSS